MEGKEVARIDIEPTWETILNMFISGHLPHDSLDMLKPAMKTMDTVRQAQKKGKKSVTFRFTPGSNEVDVIVE